jgi:hypothetical protein
MSKITNFYKKAEADEKLRSELEAANKRFEEREHSNRQASVEELIGIAKAHGYALEAADFASEAGELDEKELEAVAGGLPARTPTDPAIILRHCSIIARQRVRGIFV